MDVTKRLYQNLGIKLIFLFLLAFPFGQLLRITVNKVFGELSFPAIDAIVLLTSIPLILGLLKKPRIYKNITAFLTVAVFSNILSLYFFDTGEVLVNSLYLIRLAAYSAFFVLVWNLIEVKSLDRHTLFYSLIVVAVFSGIFGWIQYLWIPDLTSLKYLGWDDHLYRLVGTHLDPGYTGIVLVIGFILSVAAYFNKKSRLLLAVSAFLLLSIFFTYSRASFIALIGGVFTLTFIEKKKILLAVIILAFILIIPLLPRPKSEGVRLERSQSIVARFKNYNQSLYIFSEHPLFGVGYNNICTVRILDFGGNRESHACAGSDSSLLFVAVTTGVVGLMTFLLALIQIFKEIGENVYSVSFVSSAVALLLHSFFLQSIFYPWVMGMMGILLAISVKEYKKH